MLDPEFTKKFWDEKVMLAKLPSYKDRVVRVNHEHYIDMPEKPGDNRQWNGFGGAKFVIRFHDGREVTTHNLWYQGTIPEEYWDQLPDNAEFIYPEGMGK